MAPRLRGTDPHVEVEAPRHRLETRGHDRKPLRQVTAAAEPHDGTARTGAAFAAASASGYALTIIAGRTLAERGVGAPSALGIRFAVGGAVLLLLCLARRAPLLPARGERRLIFALGGVGYMLESSFFFAGLARGSTAAVTLIFYTYPALVTIGMAIRRRTAPTRIVLCALVLSFTGSALIAASGGEVAVSRAGLLFALASSVSFAVYLLVNDGLVQRSDPMTTGAWVALGAASSFVTQTMVTGGFDPLAGQWPVLIGNGVATALAFGAMFAALRRLGPSRTSVILTLEAVFAVLLAAVLLDESLVALQLVGAVAVLTAAVTIARAEPTEAVVAAADAVHP